MVHPAMPFGRNLGCLRDTVKDDPAPLTTSGSATLTSIIAVAEAILANEFTEEKGIKPSTEWNHR
jgi:hypothetical protein